jgi:hypothetical protein
MIPAFRYRYNQDRAMQFLVYLTVLMVSVSTILLEVHWLTSPAPPPRPAIQATASPPTPKIEGPNAALSPVYPKKTDAPSPAESGSNVQLSTAVATPQAAPVPRPGAAVPAQQAAPQSTAAATPPQRPAAETTGTVARDDDAKQQAAGATNVSHRAVQEMAAVQSGNRCDIQACAGAYKSFRASDCTYQSFEGPRRVCGKSPVQRAAREQRDEPERRKWSRNAYPPDLDRSTVGRRIDDDDDEGVADFDDESDQIVIRRLGRRW